MTPTEVEDSLVKTTEHDLGYGSHIIGTGMIDTEDAWQDSRYGATQSDPVGCHLVRRYLVRATLRSRLWPTWRIERGWTKGSPG